MPSNGGYSIAGLTGEVRVHRAAGHPAVAACEEGQLLRRRTRVAQGEKCARARVHVCVSVCVRVHTHTRRWAEITVVGQRSATESLIQGLWLTGPPIGKSVFWGVTIQLPKDSNFVTSLNKNGNISHLLSLVRVSCVTSRQRFGSTSTSAPNWTAARRSAS